VSSVCQAIVSSIYNNTTYNIAITEVTRYNIDMNKIELSKEQAQLLRYVYDKQQAIFSGILSTLAHEHGATVDENTQFSLNEDMTVIDITKIEVSPTDIATE